MSVRTYDFHGSVSLITEIDDPRVESFMLSEYRFAQRQGGIEKPTVHFYWHDRTPRKLPEGRLKGLRPHVHKILARWKHQLEIGGEEIRLEVGGNYFSVPMVFHMLLHPSLRYLVSKNDEILMHASAVVSGGQSLIFAGSGGSGKTTVSSLLLSTAKSDMQLHADDYVFAGPGPRTYAYLTRPHLFQDILVWQPEIGSRLTMPERSRLRFLGLLQHWTGGRITWPVRVKPFRLWPGRGIAYEADLAAVIMVRRCSVEQPRLRKISRTMLAIEKLLEINFSEASHFINFLEEEKGVVSSSRYIEEWKTRELTVLESLRRQVIFYRLDFPMHPHFDPDLGNRLLDLLEPILGGQ